MLLSEISEHIKRYYNDGKTWNVGMCMDFQDDLSCLAFELAEELATAKEDYNGKYFIRKIGVSKKSHELINKGNAVNKSEIQAIVENEDNFKIEQISEAFAYRMDILLKQTNKVLDSVRQRISHLKNIES